jgi:hypothetical protein
MNFDVSAWSEKGFRSIIRRRNKKNLLLVRFIRRSPPIDLCCNIMSKGDF